MSLPDIIAKNLTELDLGGSGLPPTATTTGSEPDSGELGDQIANLTLAQAVQLSEYLKQRHGIEPAASVQQEQRPDQPQPEKKQEKTEWTAQLDGVTSPDKKIGVIKVIREITSLGIKEAKDFVESAPKVVREALPKAEAESLKKKLEDAGGKVTLL